LASGIGGDTVVTSERSPAAQVIAVTAAQTFGLKLALAIVATIATIVVSRVLGPEGRGIYYAPLVAAATVITLAKLGLEQTNVYLYGSRSISAERLAAQSAVVTLIAGGVGMAAMIALVPRLPAVFGDVPPVLVLLAALTIPVSLHTQFIAGLQNLVGQVTLQFRAGLVASLVQLGLLLALALTRLVSLSAVMAVTLVGTIVAWLWTVKTSAVRPWSVRWDPLLVRESVGHSLVLHVGLVLFFLHLRADIFMVKAFSGATALGIYSLAVVLAETALLATDSVSIALLPRQVATALRESAQVALRVARLSAYFSVLFGLALAGTGWALIPLFFGPEFAEAYPVLLALVPGIVFISMQRVCGPSVIRAGTPWRISAIYAVSLVLNVTLNLLWIPRFGPVGASLASSVSYGLGAVMFLTWTSKLAGSTSALMPSRSDGLVMAHAFGSVFRMVRRETTERTDP
jgi:O-antigen/teichoic acid export membrane protein